MQQRCFTLQVHDFPMLVSDGGQLLQAELKVRLQNI
jgi:hypothetical protein